VSFPPRQRLVVQGSFGGSAHGERLSGCKVVGWQLAVTADGDDDLVGICHLI